MFQYMDFQAQRSWCSLACTVVKASTALISVTQYVEHWPLKWRVTGSIPGQGTCLGCRPGFWARWGACERQPIDISLTCQCFSPSLFPSLPLSQKLNKYNLKKKKVKASTVGKEQRTWSVTKRSEFQSLLNYQLIIDLDQVTLYAKGALCVLHIK